MCHKSAKFPANHIQFAPRALELLYNFFYFKQQEEAVQLHIQAKRDNTLKESVPSKEILNVYLKDYIQCRRNEMFDKVDFVIKIIFFRGNSFSSNECFTTKKLSGKRIQGPI